MKTVSSVLHEMTDVKSIMQDLKDTLRRIDPDFAGEEARFISTAATLEHKFGDILKEYLVAKEEELAMELVYIGWQGFHLNLDIFQHPVNALLLGSDYEDLNLERRLATLPAAKQVRAKQTAFHDALKRFPKEERYLEEEIDEFYSYLSTTGYKMAHYFGFRLADRFLPYVVPGYISDPVNTLRYSGELEHNMQLDLTHME